MLLSFYNYLQLIIALMLPVVSLLAVPVEPPAPFGDPRSAMYSIEDICQRLKSGEEGELRGFGGPPSGPQEMSKRCTLNEVMAVAPKKNNDSGA